MDVNASASRHFRIAVTADRSRLVLLINSAFAVESFLDYTRTDDARLAAMMEKGRILLAEDAAGRILGSVYIELRGHRGYLGMLAIDPAYQRTGLGRQLIEAAEDRFRKLGCEAVDITVLSLRPELLPIYRRFGYVETGTEEFHPSRPLKPGVQCHCIVMSKQLTSPARHFRARPPYVTQKNRLPGQAHSAVCRHQESSLKSRNDSGSEHPRTCSAREVLC